MTGLSFTVLLKKLEKLENRLLKVSQKTKEIKRYWSCSLSSHSRTWVSAPVQCFTEWPCQRKNPLHHLLSQWEVRTLWCFAFSAPQRFMSPSLKLIWRFTPHRQLSPRIFPFNDSVVCFLCHLLNLKWSPFVFHILIYRICCITLITAVELCGSAEMSLRCWWDQTAGIVVWEDSSVAWWLLTKVDHWHRYTKQVC